MVQCFASVGLDQFRLSATKRSFEGTMMFFYFKPDLAQYLYFSSNAKP